MSYESIKVEILCFVAYVVVILTFSALKLIGLDMERQDDQF